MSGFSISATSAFPGGQLDPRISLPAPASDRSASGSSGASDANSGASDSFQLSDAELEQIQKLKARDAEVRAHEQAHLAAAGSYSRGGANFTFETGPDGKLYAVGGEVQVDLSPASDPEATIRKMAQIRAAALAPAAPSAADRSVAAQAARLEAEARAEIAAGSFSPTGAIRVSGERESSRGDADGAGRVQGRASTPNESTETAAPPERGGAEDSFAAIVLRTYAAPAPSARLDRTI